MDVILTQTFNASYFLKSCLNSRVPLFYLFSQNKSVEVIALNKAIVSSKTRYFHLPVPEEKAFPQILEQ